MVTQAERQLRLDSNVTGSLLPAIFKIFSQWRLACAQQVALLGLSNERALYNWKSQPDKARLTQDQLERTSYILGIFESLQVLLPEQSQADRWLIIPNDNPLFNGTKPLNHMLAGQVIDLAVVRNFLDAERGGC
ncbi:MAG: DUF2384 domain-containing protein [Halioglobus sp.]|nr:DUF2384 domain-containing protein [Halioglobus sp.]